MKYGLEKLLGDGDSAVQRDEKEHGAETQAYGSECRNKERASNGKRQRGEGETTEVIKYLYKKLDIEEGQKQEVRRLIFRTST